MIEWIITDLKTKKSFITKESDSTKIYQMCRGFIKSRGYEEAQELDYLNELAHSYSQSRRWFGIKGVLDITSRRIEDQNS